MNKFITMLVLVLFVTSVQAGVVIGSTRVIYPSDKKTVSLNVMNDKTSGVYLVQSWVESNVVGKPSPFIITPPLFRMDAGEDNILRIVFVGKQLPEDRESVFWLNIKSIPATDDSVNSENTLQMVVKSRIKLFYRPVDLPSTPEMDGENLELRYYNNRLIIKNPGAYYISLYSLIIDGKEYNDVSMIPPKDQITLAVPHPSQVSWRTINDYGGIDPEVHRQL